jgi:ribosome-binding ATPase YchF (GTP1/OBG family)
LIWNVFVHGDRNFLRADVVAFEDYQKFQGDFLKLQMECKLRNEGRKYIVNDGDIIQFFENNTKYRKRH